MAIGDEEIDVSVVVIIEEFNSPSAHQTSDASDAHAFGGVVKGVVVIVAVDRIHFLIHVGDEKILPAILIKIGRVNAHPGSRAAILTVGDSGVEPNLLELFVAVV